MNYTELVAASRAYADRNDIEVGNNIDNFITMAEARINRLLQTREQTCRAYTPTVENEEYYSLPPDYRSMRDIQINDNTPSVPHSSYNFEYLSPRAFNVKRNQEFCGVYYYCVAANQIQIYPILDPGLTIEIIYYRKVPNLNSNNDSNWLSSEHPDIYLSGITAEIETFVKNYEVAKGWFDRMSASINELESLDVTERWSGGPMAMRAE